MAKTEPNTAAILQAVTELCNAKRDVDNAMKHPPEWDEPADPEWDGKAAAALRRLRDGIRQTEALLPSLPEARHEAFLARLMELTQSHYLLNMECGAEHLRAMARDEKAGAVRTAHADAALQRLWGLVTELRAAAAASAARLEAAPAKPKAVAESYRRAAQSFHWVCSERHDLEPKDGRTYTVEQWKHISEHGCPAYTDAQGEPLDVPEFDTWKRYVRAGLKAGQPSADSCEKSAPILNR